MSDDQIRDYEYCKEYLNSLEKYEKELTIKKQHHGCGSQQPRIEHVLEDLHRDLYSKIFNAFNEAKLKTNKIILKI
jgi:hypothetical protein